MSFFSKTGVFYADAAQIDAFGRLRICDPATLFESKFLADGDTLGWDDQQISGSGTTSTYNTKQASVTIAVGNTTAGRRVRQSKTRINYQPGKSQQIMMTFVLGPGAAGITKREMFGDDNDGIFLETVDDVISLGIRSSASGSPVDTKVAKASWNIDPMDGTGPSGVTLDFTKTQIMIIDFAWLGVSRVRIGFAIDGVIYYVHQFLHANILSVVYMSIPNLPLRQEIINDGSGPASSLTCICSTVISEGGNPTPGLRRSADRGLTGLATLNNTNIFPIVAVRLNSDHLHGTSSQFQINVICSTTTLYRWALLLNPTVTGTALSYSHLSNSIMDVAVGPTNGTTLSNGTVLLSGYEQSTTSIKPSTFGESNYQLGSTIAGVSDVLVLGVQIPGGSVETFYGGISWKEIT